MSMWKTSIAQSRTRGRTGKHSLSLVARLSWQFCLLFLLVMLLCSAFILWGLWERTYLQEYRSFQYRADKIHENITWDVTIDGFAPTDDYILDYQAIGPDTTLLIANGGTIVNSIGASIPQDINVSRILRNAKNGFYQARGYLCRAYPVTQEDENYRLIIVKSMHHQLSNIYWTGALMLVAIVICGLLTIFLGRIWAKKAAAPILRLTNQLKEVKIQHFEGELPLPTRQDEVYDLVLAENEMLSRISSTYHTLDAFSANVSHELRTPLSVIELQADILRHYVPDDNLPAQNSINTIQDQTEYISCIIKKLLFLARGEARSIILHKEKVPPYELVQLLREEQTVLTPGRTFFNHVPQDLPRVNMDPDLVHEALRALLNNAFAATPQDGIISVSGSFENGMLTFSIQDTGCGIPKEKLEHLFERFYQVTPRRAGGNGLGLPIAQTIARLHNGSISCVSEVGKGSTFTISFMDMPED